MRQIAPGEMWLAKQVGTSTKKTEREIKYRSSGLSHKLLHSLMPGNAPFISTVCMHDFVWVIWYFTQTQCINCVYKTWAESMFIQTGNGRGSTQREQENGAPQISDCDVVDNTVRNSR